MGTFHSIDNQRAGTTILAIVQAQTKRHHSSKIDLKTIIRGHHAKTIFQVEQARLFHRLTWIRTILQATRII